MALKKLKDHDPNYSKVLGDYDILGFGVYIAETDEKIGSVEDILLDESDHFRYLVVDFGLWIFNKKVLLPVGYSRIDYEAQRVYVVSLDRAQAERLPEYSDRAPIDDADSYQQDPIYELNDRDHPILKRYQDQLRARNRSATHEPVLSQPIAAERVEASIVQEQTLQLPELQPQPAPPSPSISASGKATRSACLIFNPVAGQSDPEQDLAIIKKLLQPEFNLDIRTTTPDVDAAQLAQEAVERGAELIIASGGDGTLSAAAGATIGTGIPLGVISRGTANAFATALDLQIDIEAACQTILGGVTRVVDAAYCNGKPMVLLAGIGFEAGTVERADREAKNRFGMLAYVLAGIQELGNLKSFKTRIETEDKIVTCRAAAVTIANAAPPTSVLAQGPAKLLVDDGLLDVTIVAPANTMSAIADAFSLLQSADNDAVTDQPDVGFLRARSLKVTTDPPQEVVLDGELVGHTPIEIECVPGGLTILVPADSEPPVEKLEGLPDLQIEYKDPPEEH